MHKRLPLLTGPQIAAILMFEGKLDLAAQSYWSVLGTQSPIKHVTPLTFCLLRYQEDVVRMLRQSIESSQAAYDGIVSSSVEGAIWSTALADEMNIPHFILHEGKAYVIANQALTKRQTEVLENCDLIACNQFALDIAFRMSKATGKPLIYVRDKSSHSERNRIGGDYKSGQRVYFIDEYPGGINTIEYRTVLTAVGLVPSIHLDGPSIKSADLRGLNLLIVEGVITTGAKFAQTVEDARQQGAVVQDVRSVFTFGMRPSTDHAARTGTHIHSLSSLTDAITSGLHSRLIDPHQAESIRAWAEDPMAWKTQIA